MNAITISVKSFKPRITLMNKTLFNHDLVCCDVKDTSGNHLYSGRALGLTEPGDLIQLHPDLEKEMVFIARHYDNIGLKFSRSVIWNTSYELLSEYPQYRPSFYYYGEDVYDTYVNHDFHNIVDFISSKNNFIRVAQELDLPTPQTFCYTSKRLIMDTAVFPYPCYLKSSLPTSNVRTYRCKNETELFYALNAFDDDVPLQIQKEVSAINFINMQYKVGEKGVERFTTTDKLPGIATHKGIQYSSKYPCWHVTDPFADYLFRNGMQGNFAFTVAVVNTENGIEYLLINCNPSFSGASYHAGIANKLGVESWTAEAFTTNIRSLANLNLSDIEFNAKTGSGVVLVNWGPILVGKLCVLFAGSPEQQSELREKFIKRL